MLVETTLSKRVVKDWEIVTDSGIVLPFVIDEAAGDQYLETDRSIIIKLAAKPSQSDPSKLMPAEEVVVYLSHVVSIQKREREIVDLPPEQRDELKRFWDGLKTASTTIQ